MDKTCKETMELGRFTEEFITLTGCVVRGLLELHRRSFYCPNFSGKHIAVLKERKSLSAKLWYFCLLPAGENGDMDWVRLGVLIRRTAKNHHQSLTPEIKDLCRNLKNGILKGMDILEHPALLSVLKKFDKIIALNTFVLVNCKQSSQISTPSPIHCDNLEKDNIAFIDQIDWNDPDKDKILTALKKLLDSTVGWKSHTPLWMKERMDEEGFKLGPKLETFRQFLWQVRCLLEHGNRYAAPEATLKISSRVFQFSEIQPDLESEVRKSWAYLFLIALKFANLLLE